MSSLFTHLKHFSLETNLVLMIIGALGDAAEWPLNPLETIRFASCETLDTPWLREFAVFLTRKSHWEDLHKLTREQCGKLTHVEVLDIIPKEKLEWIEKRPNPWEMFGALPLPRDVLVAFDHLIGVEPLEEWDFGLVDEDPLDDVALMDMDGD